MSGKILVIRGGAIGDFILTLPVLSALRENLPKAELHLLGYPKVAQLALAGGLADSVQPIEAQGLAAFFARDGVLPPELSDYFSKFNIIISFLYDPDEIFKTNVRRCFKGQFIQGPHRPNESENTHATEVFLKPLQRLAIFDADPVPRLPLRVTKPTTYTTYTIAIHPGSGSERKNWPEPKWFQLLKRFSTGAEFNVLMVGGEAEGDRLRRLQSALSPERLRLAHNLPLTELAEQLAESSFFVGHDSGITHLASSLGLPGLVLWGPSNATIWQPRNPKVTLISAGADLSELGVNSVFEHVCRAIRGIESGNCRFES